MERSVQFPKVRKPLETNRNFQKPFSETSETFPCRYAPKKESLVNSPVPVLPRPGV